MDSKPRVSAKSAAFARRVLAGVARARDWREVPFDPSVMEVSLLQRAAVNPAVYEDPPAEHDERGGQLAQLRQALRLRLKGDYAEVLHCLLVARMSLRQAAVQLGISKDAAGRRLRLAVRLTQLIFMQDPPRPRGVLVKPGRMQLALLPLNSREDELQLCALLEAVRVEHVALALHGGFLQVLVIFSHTRASAAWLRNASPATGIGLGGDARG